MIPKIIHFCWIGPTPIPPVFEKNIKKWKVKMPDYEFKFWGNELLNDIKVPYVEQAIKRKKYAFACDYIRLYVLYTYGGIYLDVDLMIIRRFDDLLCYNFIAGIEQIEPTYSRYGKFQINKCGKAILRNGYITGFAVQNGAILSEKNSEIIGGLLNKYLKYKFSDKTLFLNINTGPTILAKHLIKYGLLGFNKHQVLSDKTILFAMNTLIGEEGTINTDPYIIHPKESSSWDYKPLFFIRLFRNIFWEVLTVYSIIKKTTLR